MAQPPELVKVHHSMDRAVDAAFGKTNLKTEAERVAFLFECYQQLTAQLTMAKTPVRKPNPTCPPLSKGRDAWM